MVPYARAAFHSLAFASIAYSSLAYACLRCHMTSDARPRPQAGKMQLLGARNADDNLRELKRRVR